MRLGHSAACLSSDPELQQPQGEQSLQAITKTLTEERDAKSQMLANPQDASPEPMGSLLDLARRGDGPAWLLLIALTQGSHAYGPDSQHSTAQHGTAQHSTAEYSTAPHGTARHCRTARHGTTRHGTARHHTARHHTARHGTALPHSTARHSHSSGPL